MIYIYSIRESTGRVVFFCCCFYIYPYIKIMLSLFLLVTNYVVCSYKIEEMLSLDSHNWLTKKRGVCPFDATRIFHLRFFLPAKASEATGMAWAFCDNRFT